MIGLSDSELVAAAGNTLMPLLIAVALRPTWSDRTRTLVALSITLAINVGVRLALTQATDLPNDWQSWLRFMLTCAVVSAIAYMAWWKQTGVVQRVEAATSPDGTVTEVHAKMTLLEQAVAKESAPPDHH